jgi:hypothetical protein
LLAFLVGDHRGLRLLRLAAGRCRGPHGADKVGDEVDNAEHGQQPVEVVEAAVVDCVAEPPCAGLDERDERAAEEEAERERGEEEARAHGLHALGRPRDEEVQLPRVDERLACAHQQELRRQHEHADGQRPMPCYATCGGDGEALLLGYGRGGHADDGEDQADADLLQVREPLPAGHEAPAERDEDAVVEGEGEHDSADEEDGERGGWDLEAAHAAVHGGGLLHGEGDHLRVDGPEQDGRRPHRHQAGHHLNLLDAGHGAQLPRVRRRPPVVPHLVVVVAGHHRRPVEARELGGVGDARVLGAVLVERGDGERLLGDVPLPGGSDEDLEDVHDGAPGAAPVAVPPGARQEDGDGGEHGAGADAVGPAPADVVLDVDEDGDGEERADADEEEEAVEEEAHGGALARVALVELVGAKARDAGLEPAGAQRDEVEAHVQHAHLEPRGLLARPSRAGSARRRPQLPHLRGHCQEPRALPCHVCVRAHGSATMN